VNIRIIVTAAAVIAAAAGCAVRSTGAPTPSPTSEPSYADILPPRHGDIDLSDVDPCTDLLTDRQLRDLRYDLGYARPPLPDHSDIHGGPDCTFSSTGGAGGADRNILTLLGISTSEGALTWVTDPLRAPDTKPEVVPVDRFSALVMPHPVLPDSCLVVVDTADDQYLEVWVSPAVGEAPSADAYCAEAERVAGMAIQTVSKTR
jgi:hypothetical protein